LGLGTWKLEGRDCEHAVGEGLKLGYRHIDTAQAYGNHAEVGRALRDAGLPREDVFLTTKIWLENLDRSGFRAAVEQSLAELGVDYVDLLLVHWPNPDTPLAETMDALVEAREAGRTRQVGTSNFTPSLIRRVIEMAPIACNQIEYHPFLAQAEHLALARQHGFFITAYAPLARGRVTEDEVLRQVAEKHGRTPAQVSLRWLLQQDRVAAIPKASTREHLAENLGALEFELDPVDMKKIFGCARGERLVDPDFAPDWRT
jgi:2,5-diketo-D-gluconate reductase B